MTLHPEIEHVLGLVAEAGYPEFWELTPATARAQFAKTAPALDAPREPIHRSEDHSTPVAGGEIRLRILTPLATEAALPVVVFFHGGGFVVGDIETYDALCRTLANRSGAIFVSVDYRLAPEHRFPIAAEDAVAALAWVAEQAASFGADPGRIAVMGDSAGGNLAAVAAQAARDRGLALALQALVYPVIGGAPETASHHAFAEGYLLSRRSIEWFYDHYLPAGTDPADPRFAPLHAEDLSGLAPALVITAGYDPLRDEAIDYAARLIAAGNTVRLSNYAGMVHGFVSLSAAVGDGRRAIAELADALVGAFTTD